MSEQQFMNDFRYINELYRVITSPEYREAEKEIAMSSPDPRRDYEDDQRWQDDERAFFRCVELAQKAQRGETFDKQDMEDLIYHLGVKEYFK